MSFAKIASEAMGAVVYIESSALVKLIVPEPESGAIEEALAEWPHVVSSVLTAVEIPRVARRGSDSAAVAERADALVDRLDLIALDSDIARTAAMLPPPALRSLDAIHVASALSLGENLGALATYDERLRDAAERAGVTVLAPA